MKIRKRYILLIILSILPFYKIIHFDDYCINDVDYLLIAFLSIIVLVTFLAIIFFNLYQISIHRELFNYRPFLIFGVFSIALYVGLKFPDIWLVKKVDQKFTHKVNATSSAKITLFKDYTFSFKVKSTNETCAKFGTYKMSKDSLFLKLNSNSTNQQLMDSVYVFDKIEKKLKSTSSNFSNFIKN